jgi:PAS domain S-box-containing protein
MDSKKQESNAKIDKVSQICMNIKAISEALYPDSDGQLKLIKKMIHTQESLKLALEAAQIGIWEWDFQMDAVTWSETMEALHGLNPGEFVEQYGGKFEGFQQLVHPSDRELLNAAVQRAIQEKSYYNIEFRVVWPDKSIHWLNAQGKVLYDSTEKPIRMLGIGMDITERKQAIETLKQSEEGFRVAIKNSPILVFNHDRDLKYVWLYNNPGIGALDDGIIGKTDAELLAPDEADKIMAIKRKVIEEGTGTQAEIQMTIAEKLCYFMLTAEPLFDTDGTVAGITCAAFDITDRKHFEDQLRRSERLKQEIFENSADALFLVNAQTNHIEDYNQEAVRLFGFKDKQELIGKQARSLQKNPYNEAQIKKALEELRENRFWSSELEYVSKKGREFGGMPLLHLLL